MFEYTSLSVSTAALGLSVLSVGIAAWSAYTSHRSRQAAERSSEIVRVKREEELAPKFDAWLEFRDGVHHLYLKNLGVVTYASVIFHFIPADGLAGLPITGLQMAGWGEARESADFGLFEAGSTKVCIASRRQQHPGTNFRMRLIVKIQSVVHGRQQQPGKQRLGKESDQEQVEQVGVRPLLLALMHLGREEHALAEE